MPRKMTDFRTVEEALAADISYEEVWAMLVEAQKEILKWQGKVSRLQDTIIELLDREIGTINFELQDPGGRP